MSDIAPKTLKSLRRWAKIFLIIGIITSASGIAHNIYVHFNPAAARTYGRLIHVRLGGRDFAVPSEYVRGPLPHGEVTQLHLWMMLPDYTPYNGEISAGSKDLEAGWSRHIEILISDTATTTDLTYRYTAVRNGPQSIFKPEDVGEAYGLNHTFIWHSNVRSPEPWIIHDLYYQKTGDGTVSTFVACDRDTADPKQHPMCANHAFQDGRLIYQVTYRKSNLPNWRSIEERIRAIVSDFSCETISTQPHSTKTFSGEKQCPP